MTTADIYISFSEADEEFASHLRARLITPDRGIAWFDRRAAPWADIEAAIRGAKTALIVISPDWIESDLSRREIEEAVRLNIRIIPLLYRPVSKMPEPLTRLERIDFTNPEKFDAAIKQLLKVLDAPDRGKQILSITLLSDTGTGDVFTGTVELKRLLERATRINGHYEAEFDVTFSSMLLAFLISDDPLSQWFSGYGQEAGVAVDELLGARKLDRATFESIRGQPVTAQDIEQPRRRTSSAANLFQAATDFRNRLGPK